MSNFKTTLTYIILGVALISLGIIGYTYLTNAHLRASTAQQWAKSNDNRQVCKVLGKKTEPGVFGDTEYHLNLDCGSTDQQGYPARSGDTKINVAYATNASNQSAYKKVSTGKIYITPLSYIKGGGTEITGAMQPTNLPMGYHFPH